MSERDDGAIGAVDLLEMLCNIVEREGDLPVYVWRYDTLVPLSICVVRGEDPQGCPRRVELTCD